MEDVLAPFHYRLKAWVIIASLFSTATSATIYLLQPELNKFAILYSVINFAAVMHDVIAQGLTVIILNLHKSLAESKARISDSSTQEILLEGEKGTTQGKKAYGNYVMLRFILRTSSTFLGGLLSEKIHMKYFYAIIGILQILIVFYTLIFVYEERRPSVVSAEFSFTRNISSFWNAIVGKDTMMPIILMIMICIGPNIQDPGTFILNDAEDLTKRWSLIDFSLNAMIAGVFYFIFMMFAINKAKNLSFSTQILVASVANNIQNFLVFRFVFFDELGFFEMFGLTALIAIASSMTNDILLIPIVARFSLKCPAGIESFGITTIAALLNFSAAAAGVIGGKILSTFHVEKGHYENYYIPITIAFGYGLFTLILTPFLGQ